MRSNDDLDRSGIARIERSAPRGQAVVDDERPANDLDRNPVERGLRPGRFRGRRDAGGQANLERPLDTNLFKARNLERAGSAMRWDGAGKSDQECRKAGAHAPPSYTMVKSDLRSAAVDGARSLFADRAFGAAAHVDIARAHDVALGRPGRMR